jgi:hypothetical protein
MTHRKVEPENVTGVLAERTNSKGRRVKLTKKERQDFIRLQRAEAAAALFLDLDQALTWPQIAEKLEISLHQLKDISKSPEFDEAWNRLFSELGHDPRYKAAQGALADMLPLAITELRTLVSSSRTAAGTKLKAIEKIIALNGLENLQPTQSDRQDLVEFLTNKNINIGEVKITLPEQYAGLEDEIQAEVVDADYRDMPPEDSDTLDTSEPNEGSDMSEDPDDPPQLPEGTPLSD